MTIDNESISKHIRDRLPKQLLSAESQRIIQFINQAYRPDKQRADDESMILYGGSAVVLYRGHILENPRTTKDLDINIYTSDTIDVNFKDKNIDKYFQLNNLETFLIEPDWRARLIPSSTFIDASYSDRLFLLNPYDIVITKIGRFEPRDVEDCEALVGAYDLSSSTAEALIREAIRYYPLAQNTYNLKKWKENFEEVFELDLITPFES